MVFRLVGVQCVLLGFVLVLFLGGTGVLGKSQYRFEVDITKRVLDDLPERFAEAKGALAGVTLVGVGTGFGPLRRGEAPSTQTGSHPEGNCLRVGDLMKRTLGRSSGCTWMRPAVVNRARRRSGLVMSWLGEVWWGKPMAT